MAKVESERLNRNEAMEICVLRRRDGDRVVQHDSIIDKYDGSLERNMNESLRRRRRGYLGLAATILAATLLCSPQPASGAEGYKPFEGDKTAWHGFDRYDFLLDEQTLAIKPFTAGTDE